MNVYAAMDDGLTSGNTIYDKLLSDKFKVNCLHSKIQFLIELDESNVVVATTVFEDNVVTALNHTLFHISVLAAALIKYATAGISKPTIP